MQWTAVLLLVCLIFALPLSASGEELPLLDVSEVQDRFVSNPRNVKDIGDPFVLSLADGYHVYATGGPIGFFTWQSGDLKTFERKKALQKLDWASGDYWAPEVFPWKDGYVMLYTARERKSGSLRTGIAFADSPEGPFTDPLGHPLMDLGYATIDATLTTDAEGSPILIFVRDCSENIVQGRGESHIYGVKLSDDLLSIQGEPVLLLTPQGDWEIRSGDTRWNEGPAVVRHMDRWYLFYSVNGYWMKEYSVSVASADSPLGPYTRQDTNPLLRYVEKDGNVIVSGPGHNAFFTSGEELFTSYHTHTYPQAPSGNRQLCIDRAGFHRDGTAFIAGPTLAPQLRPLHELHCRNAMPLAFCSEDPQGFLGDGDPGYAPSSLAYRWKGRSLKAEWDQPVSSDLIVICPGSSPLSGTLTLNGTWTCSVEFTPEGIPGESLILPFREMEITSMALDLDTPGEIGEIYVVIPES